MKSAWGVISLNVVPTNYAMFCYFVSVIYKYFVQYTSLNNCKVDISEPVLILKSMLLLMFKVNCDPFMTSKWA